MACVDTKAWRRDINDPSLGALCVPGGTFLTLTSGGSIRTLLTQDHETFSEALLRHKRAADETIARLTRRNQDIIVLLEKHGKLPQ